MAMRIDDPERRRPEAIKAVLTGRSNAFPLAAALVQLSELDLPMAEREDLVGGVLASSEDPVARSAASISFRRLATPGARERLVAALPAEPKATVVADIALALGFVGDADDVRVLREKSGVMTDDFATARIEFAAGLIAHRLGLSEPGVDFPPATARLSVGDTTRRVDAHKPEAREIADAVAGLRAEAVGFETGPELVHGIKCGPRTLYMALNPEIAAELGQVSERKAVIGAIETYSEEHETATPAFLVLSSPADEGFDLLVTRVTGEPLYRGTGSVKDGRLSAHVWSIDTIGVAALDLEVTLGGQTLSALGVSEQTIRNQRHPTRMA